MYSVHPQIIGCLLNSPPLSIKPLLVYSFLFYLIHDVRLRCVTRNRVTRYMKITNSAHFMQEKNEQCCSFSERLNSILKSKGIKKKDLAMKLGVEPNAISRYSRGHHYPAVPNYTAFREYWVYLWIGLWGPLRKKWTKMLIIGAINICKQSKSLWSWEMLLNYWSIMSVNSIIEKKRWRRGKYIRLWVLLDAWFPYKHGTPIS